MSLNALNELKRRLEDDQYCLSKRICLAKNVVQSPYFPSLPKERIVAEWLESLIQKNKISNEDFCKFLQWLTVCEDASTVLICRTIQIASKYVQKNPLQPDDIQIILRLLENDNIILQLGHSTDDYLFIIIIILQHLKNDDKLDTNTTRRVFRNLLKFYKENKKKLEFITKLLDGENIETIFEILSTDCHDKVVNICQNILFPLSKKSYFVSFLQTLIRKDNIDDLISEKGENIQSVVKIMSSFFTFPKGRTGKNEQFLSHFIEVFVASFKNESQLIFAFCIMVVNSLNMEQSYLVPNMKMPPIIFDANDDKIKRSLFLKILQVLFVNDIDISIRLTDTLGEKVSKIEIKKSFVSFLQAVLIGQVKLERKIDKLTLQIIKIALKLDPALIEQKMFQILPPIMIAKKGISVRETYIDTMNCLLETLFKLSKGVILINQILPQLKLVLEASNTEQFQLQQKLKECEEGSAEYDKIKNKIIKGSDIYPPETLDLYGKLTTELMFRQNSELLQLLQKDFEEHCLLMLEEGFVSPSIITLTEVLCGVLSSFFHYNKMADHTVPLNIAEDFWTIFSKFEFDTLRKLGKCVLKLNYNSNLAQAFLSLSVSYSHLKLINIKYGNTKIEMKEMTNISEVIDVSDLSVLLPCLNSEEWNVIATKIDEQNQDHMDQLLLSKANALSIVNHDASDVLEQSITRIRTHLIKQMSTKPIDYFSKSYNVLFANLERSQLKCLAKYIVKIYIAEPDTNLVCFEALNNNRPVLNTVTLECLKGIIKNLDNSESLRKAMNKADFNLQKLIEQTNVQEIFNQLSITKEMQDGEGILNSLSLLNKIKIYYLEENIQLTTIFILLTLKKCCKKKIRRNIDNVLLSVFELSSKNPDLYKIFPVEFIFTFGDDGFLELLTLKNKTTNPMVIIKSVLESAVKKVKTNSEIVKQVIEILLIKKPSNKDSSTGYFDEPAFQLSCIILPIITKEKRAITTSAYRSILADLQEKLNKRMLKAFKIIDFTKNHISFGNDINKDDDNGILESNVATLNAMDAFSLTLSKYCETTVAEEIQNLDCLWSGIEFFVNNAIQTIENKDSKNEHIVSSIRLLNVILRHVKKLETHEIFQNKDKLLLQVWRALKSRLSIIHYEIGNERKHTMSLEEISITLKFLCELVSLECFSTNYLGDLTALVALKSPSSMLKKKEATSHLIGSHKVSRYLWTNMLKANIIGPKCIAMSKLMHRSCKNLLFWIRQHFESDENGLTSKKDASDILGSQNYHEIDNELKIVEIHDVVVELLKINLDTLSEVVMAAKKISLNYKFIDTIFELQHLMHYLMGLSTIQIKCKVSWQSFYKLFAGSLAVLNRLIMSREELLEDRWPCYMQCYRSLVTCLCQRSCSQGELDRSNEEKLAEMAHHIEKLTQLMSKRKAHISRLAAYTVADICSWLEKTSPSRLVRTHLENSVALLIQASDSTYAMAFLKRGLAGTPGQITMTNLYAMYKRYHKYTGNA